jgi:hypothetical protein
MVLTEITMKSMPTNIENVTPCSLPKLQAKYCLLFQGRRVNQARNQQEAGGKRGSAGFLLDLLFYPEDGGSTFLRNVSELLLDYAAFYP